MVKDLSKPVDLPILTGLPESHFKVTDITIGRPAVRACMAPEAPTRDERGLERPGAYGVLIDNVLGYSIIAGAPDDHWAVTTQMSIDFLGRLPQQREAINAEAQLLDIDDSNGYSEGTLTDSTGRVFARMRQRARVVSELPPIPEADFRSGQDILNPEESATEVSLERILGLTPVLRPQKQSVVEVSESLVNPLGNLHGGVALYLAEIVGNRTLNLNSEALLYTGSLQLTYLRPAPLGEKITLVAETLHRGRTMGVCRVAGTLSNGKLAITALVVAYAY